MTNRIFRAIFLVAAAVMLAVSLLTMGMMYQFSAEETTEKLQRTTMRSSQATAKRDRIYCLWH